MYNALVSQVSRLGYRLGVSWSSHVAYRFNDGPNRTVGLPPPQFFRRQDEGSQLRAPWVFYWRTGQLRAPYRWLTSCLHHGFGGSGLRSLDRLVGLSAIFETEYFIDFVDCYSYFIILVTIGYFIFIKASVSTDEQHSRPLASVRCWVVISHYAHEGVFEIIGVLVGGFWMSSNGFDDSRKIQIPVDFSAFLSFCRYTVVSRRFSTDGADDILP